MRPLVVSLWLVIITLSLWPSASVVTGTPVAVVASCRRPKSMQCIKDKGKWTRHFQKIRDTYLSEVNRRFGKKDTARPSQEILVHLWAVRKELEALHQSWSHR